MAALSTDAGKFDDGVITVDTEYMRPALDASHLILSAGKAAFVDTGANSSVPLLLDALAQNDVDVGDVEFVLLTHVHLDHAGGAGLLMQSLPNATCVVHPRGAPHMIDPGKLIAGTEAVYGKEMTRRMYGDIQPIAATRVRIAADDEWLDLNGRALRTFFTEGHARHHYCIHDPASAGVFTGDNFGVSYREFDTAAGPFIFPATTPASFDPPEAHKSVDRIMACQPDYVFLTHYSRVGETSRLADDMHAALDAYVDIARSSAAAAEPLDAIREGLFDYLWQRLLDHGYSGTQEDALTVMKFDLQINAQGLLIWLQRFGS